MYVYLYHISELTAVGDEKSRDTVDSSRDSIFTVLVLVLTVQDTDNWRDASLNWPVGKHVAILSFICLHLLWSCCLERRQLTDSLETQLAKYIKIISDRIEDFDADTLPAVKSSTIPRSAAFLRVWCVPATSALVERIFSQSGIIIWPQRARMLVLEMLMFLKYSALQLTLWERCVLRKW